MSLEAMPPGYDAWKTATPWDDEIDHVKTCPRHEDNHDGEPAVCTCPTPAELAAEEAERRTAAREDR